ncbi:hypothetical protein ABZW18_12870 [Streptomyces sp. NPDC004647]
MSVQVIAVRAGWCEPTGADRAGTGFSVRLPAPSGLPGSYGGRTS